MSYFPSRKPKASEYEDESIPHIDITSKDPVWEQSINRFAEQEYAMTDLRGDVIVSETIARGQRIINPLSTRKYHVVDFTDDDNFYKALNYKVNVAKVGASEVKHGVTLGSLSQKWLISPETARITVQHTTQRGIKTILHPSLLR